MRRRAFLQSLFALGAGFSALGAGFFEIARACSPHVETAFVPIPTLVGDGVHDDTAALQAWLDGKPVRDVNGAPVPQVRSSARWGRDSLCPAGAAFVSTMPAPSGFLDGAGCEKIVGS